MSAASGFAVNWGYPPESATGSPSKRTAGPLSGPVRTKYIANKFIPYTPSLDPKCSEHERFAAISTTRILTGHSALQAKWNPGLNTSKIAVGVTHSPDDPINCPPGP